MVSSKGRIAASRWLASSLALAALVSGALGACRSRETGAGAGTQERVTLAFMTFSHTGWVEKQILDDYRARSGVEVVFMPGMESVTDRMNQYLGFLQAKASQPDVYLIDVTWPSLMAEHLLDLRPELGDTAGQHFPAIIENDTVDGRLVALPAYSDAGVLFYRTDLLQASGYEHPPRTWEELEEQAARIQAQKRAAGQRDFWGFLWQGAAAEGLTCNALEWQVSQGGGRVIEDDRTVSVNNPKAVAALERAARWVGRISPPSVATYNEEDTRNVWQSGQAAFMRSWPYAYGLGQTEPGSAIKGKFDVTSLPSGAGGRSAHTLGGWQLAVSRYSTHPKEAIAFVRHMSSREVQLKQTLEGSHLSTIREIYHEPRVLSAYPYYPRLREVFVSGTVARPSRVTGRHYGAVSSAYFTAVHAILTGAPARPRVAELEARLIAITGFKAGPPSAW